MPAGDAPGTDLDLSKIPTLRPAFRQPVKSAGSAGAKVVQNARPQPRADGAARSPAGAGNAPVFFAVQLQWSVRPIELKSIPGHPIFQAYTLYAAEGGRAGRMWFFLRLGFFNDAVSAKQVADYLRGDFTSASVVPVSSQERQQAKQMGGRSVSGTAARRPPRAPQP